MPTASPTMLAPTIDRPPPSERLARLDARPSKTQRKQAIARAAGARRGAARAARRPPRRRSALAEPLLDAIDACAARRTHEGAAPPDAVHRQADALGRRRAAARSAVAELAARPRPRLARAAPGRALARRAARRRRRADALRRASTPAPTCSSCAPWCATRARTRRRRPSSATAAPTASCSSSSREHERRRWLTTRARREPARSTRVRIGLVSISDRASAGVYEDKGIPALRDWLGARAAQPDRLGDAPDRRRAARRSARRCASWSTTRAATSCSPPAAPARRRATSRPRRRSRSPTKEMPGFGEQMRRSACASCRPRSCRARSRVIRGQRADHQPAGPAEGDRRDARRPARRDAAGARHLRRGALLHRPDRRPLLETDDAVCKAFRPKSALERGRQRTA